jgi:DNA polymerase III epsilon subunit-like protein
MRWWDGVQWTGAVTGALSAPAVAQPPAARSIKGLFGDADRIAVIDVETTGLYKKDRIVEIAIVTLDANGVITEEFDTLINPARDVGPTWIHRITPSMVSSAPLFADVAGHIAARVHGAVCVGHNLRFDSRMISHEMQRVAVDIDWGVGLDTLSVTGCKLGQTCADHGIALEDAHRALADARATAIYWLRWRTTSAGPVQLPAHIRSRPTRSASAHATATPTLMLRLPTSPNWPLGYTWHRTSLHTSPCSTRHSPISSSRPTNDQNSTLSRPISG